MTETHTASGIYTVLAVCTGNICRSPAMDRLLAHLMAGEHGIRVHSGGTFAHDGEDMQAPMKQRVDAYGADAENFVAEQVTAEMVRSSDLILTATRVHVEDLLAQVPEAAERTFTVRELGRLLNTLDAERLSAVRSFGATAADRLASLVPLLDDQRRGTASPGDLDDVVDPYMLPDDIFDESFRQLSEPIEALADVVVLD